MAWGCQVGVETPSLQRMKTTNQSNPTELYATIKLGIDAHAKWFYVARQLDGATPRPVQKMTFEGPREKALNPESCRIVCREFPQK